MDDQHLTFVRRLAELTIDELDAIAASVEDSLATSADWLERRRANHRADQAVRRLGRQIEAGLAGHAAVDAVLEAFGRDPFASADARVTIVARAARDAASALVVSDVDDLAADVLLRPFAPAARPMAAA